MPEKLIPLLPWPGFDPSFSGHNDEQSSASEQDYASNRSAIGAGCAVLGMTIIILCNVEKRNSKICIPLAQQSRCYILAAIFNISDLFLLCDTTSETIYTINIIKY